MEIKVTKEKLKYLVEWLGKKPMTQIAKDLEVNYVTLWKWKNKLEKAGFDLKSFKVGNPVEETIEELKKEYELGQKN